MITLAMLALRGSLPFVKNAISALHLDERGQDAFEYLLVIGGVSVAIVALMATPVGSTIADAVVEGVCNAINTIPVGDDEDGLIPNCDTLGDDA